MPTLGLKSCSSFLSGNQGSFKYAIAPQARAQVKSRDQTWQLGTSSEATSCYTGLGSPGSRVLGRWLAKQMPSGQAGLGDKAEQSGWA